jgi:HD-GYP domain-containing protein (c-di-GMP phosphodiesterase class II)
MELRLRKNNILDILKINEKISRVKDIDSLLDLVLLEARTITGADAGSIYLLKDNRLSFEYVQNDTLMARDQHGHRYLYQKQEIDIDNRSIAGFVAANKKPLNIPDVYRLPGSATYAFNRSFDESSAYRTQSVLTVPIVTIDNKIVGVMQIINAKDAPGQISSFSRDDTLLVSLLANQAASAIERARMTREVILRMIKMAELRDERETGAHVNRVGAFTIEIYQRWAFKNRVPEKEVERIKDILRIAAMLHDVGKVAISDVILKKNSSLDNQEYELIKLHTVYGARLFRESNSDWDDMAAEIALNHHEKWDGNGYPGHIENIFNDPIQFNRGKAGEEIPLVARIVALADVYDALTSHRCYKDSWPEERVVDYIEHEKGKHFDPQVVDSFLDIYDVIRVIRQKYPDKPDEARKESSDPNPDKWFDIP